MASANGVWGIEIGQCALKAVKLREAEDGKVELVAFDLIEHAKILSQPDADPEELIRAAIEKFASRNEWQGDRFVIGVPGQQTFARFIKLPPVDAKKIPDIVRFEASQQIPFEMDDVVWDYQVFQNEDMPDVEVGIFAMRKDLVRKHLDYYTAVGVSPQIIQTVPSALYNFCRFDARQDVTEGEATVVIDVGAQNTDLIVVEQNSAWARNIAIGGNNFTEALVKAFKLSFAKAETLKKTAGTSKHARQIFQAMRPVFAELVGEIQRSLGFYGSTRRDVELKSVLACGNAFRLTGLKKYLANNLSIDDVRELTKFEGMVPSATANAPNFTENIMAFGAAYGLALQGLDHGRISANLLPTELARIAMWNRKRPYFAAAAACLGLAAGLPFIKNSMDAAALAGDSTQQAFGQAKSIVDRARQYQSKFGQVSTDSTSKRERIEKLFELHEKRDLVPRILAFVHEALPQPDPAIAAASTPAELKEVIASNPTRFARINRGQVVIEHFYIQYMGDVDAAARPPVATTVTSTPMPGASAMTLQGMGGPSGRMRPGGNPMEMYTQPTNTGGGDSESGEGGSNPGFYVHLAGRVLYGAEQHQAASFLSDKFLPALMTLSRRPGLGFFIPTRDEQATSSDKRNLSINNGRVEYHEARHAAAPGVSTPFSARGAVSPMPAAPGANPDESLVRAPDPVTGEDMATDFRFNFGFKIKLGEPPAEEQPEGAATDNG